jgi:tetratricopeptide (TPR) repeat protein
MNALHAKFKDQGLVIIGANVMGDTEAKASAFVDRQGDKMAYRVAYDGKPGQIAKDWLEAANVRGIPHAFVVRDSKILWHGHPLDLTEENVRNVMNGGTIAVKSPAEQAKLDETVVTYRKARLEVLALLQRKEADAALAKITEKEGILAGTDPADPDLLRAMAWSIKGDKETSIAHYHKAVTAGNGDSAVLFRVAYGLMDYGTVRDNDLALQCAREAARKDDNPFVLHMQARAELAAGNKDAAIAILEKLAGEEAGAPYREELQALKDGRAIPTR